MDSSAFNYPIPMRWTFWAIVIVSPPLAIWKLVEISLWLFHHLHVDLTP